jgi:hypothetical protein
MYYVHSCGEQPTCFCLWNTTAIVVHWIINPGNLLVAGAGVGYSGPVVDGTAPLDVVLLPEQTGISRESNISVTALGGPAVAVDTGYWPSRKQPSLYSSLLDCDRLVSGPMTDCQEIPDLDTVVPVEDHGNDSSDELQNTAVSGGVEHGSYCDGAAPRDSVENAIELMQPLDGPRLAHREVVDPSSLGDGSQIALCEVVGSAQDISNTALREYVRGSLPTDQPHSSCHDTGERGSFVDELPVEGMLQATCPVLGEVDPTATSGGMGLPNAPDGGPSNVSVAQVHEAGKEVKPSSQNMCFVKDTPLARNGSGEQAAIDDELGIHTSRNPPAQAVRGGGSNTECQSELELHDQDEAVTLAEPSTACGSDQGRVPAERTGQGQRLGRKRHARRRSRARTWFRVGRSWKCV